MGRFMGKTISKINAELIVSGLHKANTIVEKEVYVSNFFWLLLTANKSLVLKIVSSRPLPSRQYSILMNY